LLNLPLIAIAMNSEFKVKIMFSNQQKIFLEAVVQKQSVVLNATAGSGKTTTLIEAYNSTEKSKIVVAFNKAIATNLSKKGIRSTTLHSLGLKILKSHFYVKVNPAKMYEIAESRYPKIARDIVPLAELAIATCCCSVLELKKELYNRGVEISEETAESLDISLHLVQESRELFRKNREICFAEMVSLPVTENLLTDGCNTIFADEIQDLSLAQIKLLQLQQPEVFVGVGDPDQNIMTFAGSHLKSFECVKNLFNCKEFFLTETYRCPQKLVDYFKKYSTKQEIKSLNPKEGRIDLRESLEDLDWVDKDTLVLIKSNHEAIEPVIFFLKKRIPFCLLGGEKLKEKAINLLDASSSSLAHKAIDEIFKKTNKEDMDETLSYIRLFTSLLTQNMSTEKLKENVLVALSSQEEGVKISTVHKAKGLESQSVCVLGSTSLPDSYKDMSAEEISKEKRLAFVAYSRSKENLYLLP